MTKISVAVGLALMVSACGGDTPVSSTPVTPTPPPVVQTNRAPVITSVNISPTFGIAYLTRFGLTGRATDADGDALSYTWTLLSSGQNVGTSLGADAFGAFNTNVRSGVARLVVDDGHGHTTSADTAAFTCGALEGKWIMTSPRFPGDIMLYVTLHQSPTGLVIGDVTDFAGNVIGHNDPGGTATIDANGTLRNLRIKFQNGAIDFTISGQMIANLTVPGTITNTTATFGGVGISGLSIVLSQAIVLAQ